MGARRRLAGAVGAVALVVGTIVVGGSGASASTADPASLDFGTVPVGQSLTLQTVVTPDPGFSIDGAIGLGGGLAPPWHEEFHCTADAPCVVAETFSPTSAGLVTATLNMFECPDPGGSCPLIPIALSGIGGAVGSGTMTAGPGTVSPGDQIAATSVTPCPTGTTSVSLVLTGPDGSSLVPPGLANITSSSGDWAGTLTVPLNVTGPVFITAYCMNHDLTVQNYNDVAITVRPTATTTALSTSGSPSDYGQPVTFRAVVTGGTPTGSVGFFDGSTGLGTAPVIGGSAQLTISTLAVGTHTITAVYNGDEATSSASLTQVVRRASTNLVAATERKTNPTTFSATLTSDGSPVPGQTITFTTKKSFGGTAVQCTATTNGSGVATCFGHNAVSLSGKRVYTATFAGTPNYDPATASGRLTS